MPQAGAGPGLTPEKFARDRYLRASGYNFYVWAAVNLLVTVPLFAALHGHPWPEWLAGIYPLVLIAAGIVLSGLNDKRVEKMWGQANSESLVEAGRIWGPMFLLGLLLTTILIARGPIAYIQPLWLILVGSAYLQWGTFGVPEFRYLGWVLAIAGVVAGLSIRPGEIPPGMAARGALVIWVIFMGVLWVPFGAFINWKYVYQR